MYSPFSDGENYKEESIEGEKDGNEPENVLSELFQSPSPSRSSSPSSSPSPRSRSPSPSPSSCPIKMSGERMISVNQSILKLQQMTQNPNLLSNSPFSSLLKLDMVLLSAVDHLQQQLTPEISRIDSQKSDLQSTIDQLSEEIQQIESNLQPKKDRLIQLKQELQTLQEEGKKELSAHSIHHNLGESKSLLVKMIEPLSSSSSSSFTLVEEQPLHRCRINDQGLIGIVSSFENNIQSSQSVMDLDEASCWTLLKEIGINQSKIEKIEAQLSQNHSKGELKPMMIEWSQNLIVGEIIEELEEIVDAEEASRLMLSLRMISRGLKMVRLPYWMVAKSQSEFKDSTGSDEQPQTNNLIGISLCKRSEHWQECSQIVSLMEQEKVFSKIPKAKQETIQLLKDNSISAIQLLMRIEEVVFHFPINFTVKSRMYKFLKYHQQQMFDDLEHQMKLLKGSDFNPNVEDNHICLYFPTSAAARMEYLSTKVGIFEGELLKQEEEEEADRLIEVDQIFNKVQLLVTEIELYLSKINADSLSLPVQSNPSSCTSGGSGSATSTSSITPGFGSGTAPSSFPSAVGGFGSGPGPTGSGRSGSAPTTSSITSGVGSGFASKTTTSSFTSGAGSTSSGSGPNPSSITSGFGFGFASTSGGSGPTTSPSTTFGSGFGSGFASKTTTSSFTSGVGSTSGGSGPNPSSFTSGVGSTSGGSGPNPSSFTSGFGFGSSGSGPTPSSITSGFGFGSGGFGSGFASTSGGFGSGTTTSSIPLKKGRQTVQSEKPTSHFTELNGGKWDKLNQFFRSVFEDEDLVRPKGLESFEESTKITELNLEFGQITSLPPEIGLLVSLQTLNLHENKLGSLPPEIGQLINLQTLNLRKNQLESLPPEIGQLINLQTLNLSFSKLESLPPEIGQLINLQTLNLSFSKLESLPPEIGQLINLQTLNLSYTELQSLPPEIGQLINLQTLNLSSYGNSKLANKFRNRNHPFYSKMEKLNTFQV